MPTSIIPKLSSLTPLAHVDLYIVGSISLKRLGCTLGNFANLKAMAIFLLYKNKEDDNIWGEKGGTPHLIIRHFNHKSAIPKLPLTYVPCMIVPMFSIQKVPNGIALRQVYLTFRYSACDFTGIKSSSDTGAVKLRSFLRLICC